MDNLARIFEFDEPQFKDGDGGGPGVNPVLKVEVIQASNGFIVQSYYGDGDILQEVHLEDVEMIHSFLALLGLDHKFLVKAKKND
jgi:hypothetical protein